MNREEEIIQSKCVMWYDQDYPHDRGCLFHVDNNSWNSIIGSKKKALGVRAGVSDLILILEYKVVFIEIKTRTGEQSDEQKRFQNLVLLRGHEYYIVRSLEEFQTLIITLYG